MAENPEQFTQMSRARIRRRYLADEKGQPLPKKPCENYERRGLLDVSGLKIPGCEDYCRCGLSEARHDPHLKVVVAGICVTGDCDCRAHDQRPVLVNPMPMHDGCTCYVVQIED